MTHSNNICINLKIRENYANECFYHYMEISLLFHILQFKIGILFIILCNLEIFIKYNWIKAEITYIGYYTIKAKVIKVEKQLCKLWYSVYCCSPKMTRIIWIVRWQFIVSLLNSKIKLALDNLSSLFISFKTNFIATLM